MAFVTYTISEYLESKTKLADRIIAIDALIDKMILSTVEAVDGMNPTIGEYQLDDGQVKVKTVYRSIEQVQSGITALEQIKQMYVNRLRGRITVLRNRDVFRR